MGQCVAVFYILEALGVEVEASFSVQAAHVDEGISMRRATLAHLYNSLPQYNSPEFWCICEQPDLPLEILVKIVRCAICQNDSTVRARVVECIMRRIITMNEKWSFYILKPLALPYYEYQSLAYDLCAELYLAVIRALFDPERVFWEENFRHCLEFEKKHVYRSLLVREGRWHDKLQRPGNRIPRSLMASLDQLAYCVNNCVYTRDVEDEQAQVRLHAIEQDDLLQYILRLPERLKMVILLLFWEERSEKEVAELLRITARAVRYRLRTALQCLRTFLEAE